MTHIFLASITTQICWWISKNPSYVLWSVVAGLIVFAVVTYMFIKAKKQNVQTHADYLRMNDENNSNIIKIKSLETNVNTIGQDLSLAQKAMAELQEQLIKETSKYQELSDRYQNTKNEIDPLRQQLEKEHNNTETLSKELSTRNSEIHSLQQQVSVLKQAGLDTETLKEEITVLKNDLAVAKEKKSELENDLEAANEKISLLEKDLETAKEKNSLLENDLKARIEKISKLENDIELEKEKTSRLENELTLESEELAELKTKYDENLRQLSPLRMQLGKVQKTVSTLTEALDSAKSENTSLQQRIEELESAVVEKDALIIERNKTISELVANISEKEHILSETDLLFAENKSVIDNKDAEIANKDAEIAAKNAEIESKNLELSEKNQIIADNEAKIKELESKTVSTTSNSSSNEELEKERDLLIEQLESANSERDIKGKELQEQTVLAEARGKEIERITEELRKANDIINALNAKVIELTALLNTPTVDDSEPISEEAEVQIPSPGSEPTVSEDEITKEDSLESKEHKPKQETEDQQKEDTVQETITSVPSKESSTATPVSAPSTKSTTKGKFVAKKHVRPIEEADEDVDLPIIENKTGYVKRSILQVIDVEQEEEELIDADEFFSRSPEEIANVARMLAEAAESGREAYVCACCKTPVKISKRDFGSREVLFFSHCTHGVACDWKQEHGLLSKPSYEYVEGEPYDGKARYREIKRLVVESLSSGRSRAMGITDVEADKKIRSQHKFMYNRTAGVYAKFGDKDLVIELQTKDVYMNTVVEKDMFYRLNNHNVIWVFGADDGGGYDFINKHVPKNIMFANKRNVFILDKQAIEACEKRMELVLKCNYLDPDGRWHYRKEKQGINGRLVTLDELSFDEDMCKAYYYDANEDYFNANPDIKKEYYDSIVSKEKMLKDLKDTWEGKVAERRKKLSRKNVETVESTVPNISVPDISIPNIHVVKKPTPTMPVLKPASPIQDMPKAAKPVISVVPVKKEEPVKTFTGYSDRYIYSFEGKKGLVDGQDNIIIPCEYSDIQVWTRGKYRVKKIDLWGVVDESRKFIVDIKYKEIGKLNNGKALVKTSTESYYIYENGARVLDETITLQNGWIKFRQGDQWGISDSKGNIKVDCIYDEIGSFRGRLIGFNRGDFSRLSTRFEYRMKIRCKCVNNHGNRAHYEINGVKMEEATKQTANISEIYDSKQINNISYLTNTIYVSTISEKKLKAKIGHVDQDSDFRVGEVVNVTINKSKGKKIYVITDDGRETYFTQSVLTSAGKRLSSFPPGASLKIKKKGFDPKVERTIWQYVK